MIESPLSRIATVAAVLLGAAAPALAQTASETGPRPHRAYYGEDSQYRKQDAQSPLPADRAGSRGPYRRPHHADY